MIKRRGFTLIELLIVMAILGILTVIGVGNFQSARIKARDLKRKSDLATISKSLEAYANDYGSYPRSNASGEIICQPPNTACPWGSAFTDGGTKNTIYAAALPEEDLTGRVYKYVSATGADFRLYAILENEEDPAIDTGLTEPCGSETCNYLIKSSNLTD